MKNSWLKKTILILLLLDAIVGTIFGIHIYLSKDIVFFEKYYLIVIYAILFYIVALIYSIVRICKMIKAKRIAIAEEKARLEEERLKEIARLEEERLKEIERQKAIEAEKKRIAQVKEEIDSIISRYKTVELPKPPLVNDVGIYTEIENVQAVQIVKQYKVDQTNDINKCLEIYSKIQAILDVELDLDEKLQYLKTNLDILNSLKADSEELVLRINTRKIVVSTEGGDATVVGSLLGAIGKSKKCVSSPASIKTLIAEKTPAEYSLFSCLSNPTILQYENISYCVFDNIILVFDCDGVFLTAIKPSSLLINFKKCTCYVEVLNDRIEDNEYIGKDSRLLEEGETHYSWLYMRKDGMPDKRRTYNPCYARHKDKYEYGVLSFKLLDTVFTYSFSSANAANYALELSYKYDAKKYDEAKLCEIIYEKSKVNEK